MCRISTIVGGTPSCPAPTPNPRWRHQSAGARSQDPRHNRPSSILGDRMASDRATLNVSDRTGFGSRPTRRPRRAGLVPGIVYGGGKDARHFQVPEREARSVLLHGGALIDVQFDGSGATPVVVKEEQRDPVRGGLLHLDLLEVKLDEAIQAEVSIELLGGDDAP